MGQDTWSKEVTVRLFIEKDVIVELETFCHEMVPENRGEKLTNAEWVEEHIRSCMNAEDIKELVGIEEDGIFQVLMKVKIHGWWSGWEIEEYDEELEMIESQFKLMPADWFEQFEKFEQFEDK